MNEKEKAEYRFMMKAIELKLVCLLLNAIIVFLILIMKDVRSSKLNQLSI